MMFDCRKGECGLCEVRIRQVEGAIDHRDVFYSTRQKNATEKMACCVSRAVTSATAALGTAGGARSSGTAASGTATAAAGTAVSRPAVVTIEVP